MRKDSSWNPWNVSGLERFFWRSCLWESKDRFTLCFIGRLKLPIPEPEVGQGQRTAWRGVELFCSSCSWEYYPSACPNMPPRAFTITSPKEANNSPSQRPIDAQQGTSASSRSTGVNVTVLRMMFFNRIGRIQG